MSKRRKQRRRPGQEVPARKGREAAPNRPHPAPEPIASVPTARRLPWAVGLALIISASVVISESLVAYRTAIVPARQQSSSIRPLSGHADESVALPGEAPRYFIDFDGYYWVTYAQQMVSDGDLRVRRTDLDNAPFGREVHWSSVFSWWLIVLGGLHAIAAGMPFDAAIASAASVANPVLMGVLLTAVGWSAARRLGHLGNLGGFLLVTLLALQPALLRDFGYARPDHHGLHLICALGVILLVVLGGAGWVGSDDRGRAGLRSNGRAAVSRSVEAFVPGLADARRWFVAAGVLGGCGLWVGATQQAVVIGCVGLAGLVAAIAATRRAAGSEGAAPAADRVSLRWAPELWLVWSRAGALTSGLAYLVEYAPNHLGMRLEVNHPLYAVAWWCAGEILYLVGRRRLTGEPFSGRVVGKVALLAGGIGLLPVLALLGPSKWYLPRDPLMLRLHSLIGEFRPLVSEVQGPGELALALAPALMIVVGSGFLARRGTHGVEGALLLVSLIPALCLGVLFVLQVRWEGFFVVASCVAVVPLLLVAESDRSASAGSRIAALIVLVAVTAQLLPDAARVIRRAGAAAPLGGYMPLSDEVFARDLALILDAASGGEPEPLTVMTGLAEGSRIHAFSRARAVGSQYWENLEGVRDTVDFFADDGDEVALAIARDRQVRYIVVTRDLVSMTRMLEQGREDLENLESTLAYRLFTQANDIPGWCRPFVVRGFRWADECRIYRVTGLPPVSD